MIISQAFFVNGSDVYPGKWDWREIVYYHDLKLFDGDGNFMVDVEMLEMEGLLIQDYIKFKVRMVL